MQGLAGLNTFDPRAQTQQPHYNQNLLGAMNSAGVNPGGIPGLGKVDRTQLSGLDAFYLNAGQESLDYFLQQYVQGGWKDPTFALQAQKMGLPAIPPSMLGPQWDAWPAPTWIADIQKVIEGRKAIRGGASAVIQKDGTVEILAPGQAATQGQRVITNQGYGFNPFDDPLPDGGPFAPPGTPIMPPPGGVTTAPSEHVGGQLVPDKFTGQMITAAEYHAKYGYDVTNFDPGLRSYLDDLLNAGVARLPTQAPPPVQQPMPMATSAGEGLSPTGVPSAMGTLKPRGAPTLNPNRNPLSKLRRMRGVGEGSSLGQDGGPFANTTRNGRGSPFSGFGS